MRTNREVTLALTGDVMTGRGIDQILPYPGDPRLYEPYVGDAREYVKLAEHKSGPIRRGVDFSYIWGDALEAFERTAPDIRLINLETSITDERIPWPGKGINYKMNPPNFSCLTAAEIDCCVLANNHVIDWGFSGLADTLRALQSGGVDRAGAGLNLAEAQRPAVKHFGDEQRIVVFALGAATSGIPESWAATEVSAGVLLLPNLDERNAQKIGERILSERGPHDIIVVSIHWGANWGYSIPQTHVRFAHRLIDMGAADLIHGHSSHHVLPFQIYKKKLILYGCGDFIDDYEGIGGHERYRSELTALYAVTMESATGNLVSLRLLPLEIKHFRLNSVAHADALWLCERLCREGARFGTRVSVGNDGALWWNGP
ncbi:MAG: poly-gamma-glutamate biosynthesis protein [Chitinivibrionales bacterium]|nr:poly-gamma-glutamate biosynthesis protein [Chitinivibrionales bacterium]MBD3356178.1 poly-gamma-glutamate biosynthesis protein [Chitinivibrionales bacterium]